MLEHFSIALIHRTFVLAVLLVFAASCGERGGADAENAQAGVATQREKLSIVATTGMVRDIVSNVAGDRAEVVGLIGSGVDPHLYKPTRRDVQRLLDADVIFYNGLLLEGKMTDALIRAATSGKKVHAVTELIDEQYLIEPSDLEGLYDPHVWMDPGAWSRAVLAVRDALVEFDPEHAPVYEANTERYMSELGALEEYADRVLKSVDPERRVLVTAHDAFNYFGERFGFEVVGIQGISTESEAGVLDIERLVSMLVERKIGAVFVETSVSDRNINAIITGARAQDHTVVIGGRLFSDAMGDQGTYTGTYIGMIDHNVTTIARALGGDAPESGLNGELSP